MARAFLIGQRDFMEREDFVRKRPLGAAYDATVIADPETRIATVAAAEPVMAGTKT
jgi:hypothetical protein